MIEQPSADPTAADRPSVTAADVARVSHMVLITDTIARIAQLADEGDLDSYLALFTEDSVWTMPANPATGVGRQVRAGAADIRSGATERRRAGVQGPGTATRHIVTTTSVQPPGSESDVEQEEDDARETDVEARALSYFRFYADTVDAPRLVSLGTYRDVFRWTSAGWRLASRTIGLG